MIEFSYDKASSASEAISLLGAKANAKYLGGGTNLVDLMREGIEAPASLIDVTALSQDIVVEADGGIHIGAGATNTAVAAHPEIRARYPVLARAILTGASAQIRNMATVGGNILQRTRCIYFYDDAARCNKRLPGSGCDAMEGFNRYHAIMGASPSCIATNPSDMCVALAALDATVTLNSPGSARSVDFTAFHRLPAERPDIETALQPGELIMAIDIPALPFARRSAYRKIRDRASYAFALISVAAAIDVEGDVVRDVRLALGGVAHKPWRAVKAEAALRGQPANETAFRQAAETELQDAKGLHHNAFKIELAKRAIVAVLSDLAGTQS